MKEKYTKPEINIMINIYVAGDDDNKKSNGNQFYANGDIIGGITSGTDDGEL